MDKFRELKNLYLEKLNKYIPIVARVHGNHPELREVQTLFKSIYQKIQDSGEEMPDLEVEFLKLREITTDYMVPEDACETYRAVYEMLASLDKAFFA